jgi:flagellin-like hook-associated protein FlgL
MKASATGTNLLIMISALVISLGLLGCGMTITQQAAQRAVADAQIAVSDARTSQAPLYSTDKMKKAERLLKESEEAISRGRKQRAYTLAMRAEETARVAEQEARVYMEDSGLKAREYPVSSQTGAKYQPSLSASPASPRSTPQKQVLTMPAGKQVSPESFRYETPPQQMPDFVAPDDLPSAPDAVLSDAQIRIHNAVKTLEEAQAAVDSARAMIAKAQAEIGLSMSDFTLQQLRISGVSADMINLVESWYDYARGTAKTGNYEEASRAVKRAQSYAQSLSR